MTTGDNRNFTIFLVTVGIISFIVLIVIILLPFIMKKCCRIKKVTNQSEDQEGLLKESDDGFVCIGSPECPVVEHRNTDVECNIEYRTRGTQLIVHVAKVVPCSVSWRYIKESKSSKICLLVYVDGDCLNSPCQSTKHDLADSILFNEIFIFTVMPYDVSSLCLVFQMVLICGNWRYDIGHLKFPLHQFDQSSYLINKTLSLPIPDERSLVHECLLSLSMMKSKNTVKLKVAKLYFLHSPPDNHPSIGLHVRAQMTDFQNPLQIFDTTKKKCQQCITFNEMIMFQFEQPLSNTLELEILLLESCGVDQEETVSVSGRTVLYFSLDKKNEVVITINDDHLTEVVNNPDLEVIRWHSVPYVWASGWR